MGRVRFVVLATILSLVAGCAGGATPTSPPTGSTPPGVTMSAWQLRYLLLSRYPDFAYCDPDFYPVARDDEADAAERWWNQADHSGPEVLAILAARGYREPLTADQRLAAYRDHKKLTVIAMTAVPGGFRYELSTGTAGGEPDQTVTGTVTPGGRISEASRTPRLGGCPICLEANARIATPQGEVDVSGLHIGDVVWTADAAGHRVRVAVIAVVRRPTPGPHLMLRVALSDGRTLVAAGAHPTADGRYLRELRIGQAYDRATVTAVTWVLSTAPATYDVLPAGPTGDYWANGVLIGSTLAR
jgi:hypothetical protein